MQKNSRLTVTDAEIVTLPQPDMVNATIHAAPTGERIDANPKDSGSFMGCPVIWLLAGTFSIALTMLMFFPANWITPMVEKQTGGRLTLGDAHGTLWRGSAFLGGAASSSDPLTPLLPGRFSWRLSPMVLLGVVDAELENDAALSQPVTIAGNWHQWTVESGSNFIIRRTAGCAGRAAEYDTAVRTDALIMAAAGIDPAERDTRDDRQDAT